MNIKEIRAYCMDKFGSVKCFPFGDSPECYKAGGMIFTQILEEKRKITLRCNPDMALWYREQFPDAVVRGYHCPPIQQPYFNTITIDMLDDNIILDMIDQSYGEIMKRLTKKKYREFIGAVTKKELCDKGAIYVEKIQDGFEKFDNKLLEGTNDIRREYIKKLWIENGNKESFVDMYFGTLQFDEQAAILEKLSEKSKIILQRYYFINEVLFLQLSEELLELTLELNEKELLFCTWYFTKTNNTIWGNYDGKYPIFSLNCSK